MKRAELMAWSALAGLLAIAAILLCGGLIYAFTGFWVAMMLVLGQALVIGLAGWGLMLARQAAELREIGPISGTLVQGSGGAGGGGTVAAGAFRMSVGGDDAARIEPESGSHEAKTLDTTFQRILTALAGVLLVGLAFLASGLVYSNMHWAALNPDQPFPIAGSFPERGKPYIPLPMNELSLVIGMGAAGIYAVYYWITRPRKNIFDPAMEMVHGTFLLGISGMVALAAASILGYLKVAYASEIASGIIATLMALQGLELLVNCMRSYSGIEELDQEAIDLQAQPLVPMLGSVWLQGLKMLFAQSVGLSGEERGEKGVIARMMPRAIAAIIIIAIAMSCIRVVRPGEVAILERLGMAPTYMGQDGKSHLEIMQPGMHLTFPWPIDELVRIPTETLQFTDVGAELHAPAGAGKLVDFQFWMVRGDAQDEGEESEFITGDPGSQQLLETYVGVWWRVADPEKFYTGLSHSEFFEKNAGETRTLPIYEAMVKQCTSFAVTRAFAIHTLNQIMIGDRPEVERHCREILQEKLNQAGTGIEIVDLAIKDLHPPFWKADTPDPTAWGPDVPGLQVPKVRRGPASAFEYVVSMRELKEMLINMAKSEAIVLDQQARGQAASELNRAATYKAQKIATAQGEAQRLVATLQGQDSMTPEERRRRLELLVSQAQYLGLRDEFEPIMNKIVVDPKLDIELYLVTEKGLVPIRPPSP